MKKNVFIYSFIYIIVVSCSRGNEYIDAIPKKCPLVASVDLTRNEGMGATAFLKELFQIGNMEDNGVDVSKKVYAFESPNGYYGLCLSVSDQSNLKELLAGNGYKLSKFRGCNFAVSGNSWVIGFDDSALLVMGPVNSNEQRNVMIEMAGYLGQDSEKGLRASALISRLDSIQAPVALVSTVKSLPELLRSSLMLCSPNQIDLSKLYYCAGITLNGNYIQVDGSLFSAEGKDEELLKAYQTEKMSSISGKYLQYTNDKDFLNILLNTKSQLTNLTEGKADFEKLFTLLNASSKSNINYKSVFAGVSEEILIGMPTHTANLRILVSHLDTVKSQYLNLHTDGVETGRLTDGTFCIGCMPGKTAIDNRMDVVIGKRAAMLVNLKELQRVSPLPLLTNVQRVLGDRQTMIIMVR